VRAVAKGLAGLVALEHVGIMVLEMFFWDHPVGRRVFNMTPEVSAASRVHYRHAKNVKREIRGVGRDELFRRVQFVLQPLQVGCQV
jgi:hypothetical protein